jgi:23S rRNA (adenine2503-C2)-methyltransferase
MASFINAGEDKVEAFADYLRSQGINTNLRRSRGKDIDAACGQLAINEKEKEGCHRRRKRLLQNIGD